jgi:tRNA splicing ligase
MQIEDQHTQHSTQVKLNIIKMERLVWQLKTAGLSITTNHKNPIQKHKCLGNQLMHAASVY